MGVLSGGGNVGKPTSRFRTWAITAKEYEGAHRHAPSSGEGSGLSERLTRRVFLRRTALATAGFAATYLVAAPVGAVIFPGGQTAVIANTDGDSVRLRSAPSKNADVQAMVGEGAVVLITNGPKDAEGATWYQVQFAGKSGWIVADFIAARKLSNFAAVTFTDGQGVRLRDNTDTGANVVGMVPEGAIVQIVEGPKLNKDGTPWYHVNHAGKHGYLMGTFLVPTDAPVDIKAQAKKPDDAPATKAPDVSEGDRVKVSNTDNAGVRLRDKTGYDGALISIVEEDTVLTVTGKPQNDSKGNGWVPVSFDGTKGFVIGTYLVKTDAAATKKQALPDPAKTPDTPSAPNVSTPLGSRIVGEAMKYVGYPYVWAGASPGGFDCSGFTMYVTQKIANKNISHSMGQQVASGQYVAKENLQPGDLVFFANTYTAGLSHAGIYIGGGRFVHAENEGTGVVVSSMNSGYYGPKYYTARRMG